METVINGVTYVSAPDPTEGFACEKCALNDSGTGCIQGYGAGCYEHNIFWLRKDQVRQEVETKKAFGLQIPLFPEIEPPVTDEEEQAFQHLEKKQVGGTHYLNPMQPWDIIKAWELNYWAGNVIKYTLRHPYKGRKEDLEKAKHYLEYMIENYDELY